MSTENICVICKAVRTQQDFPMCFAVCGDCKDSYCENCIGFDSKPNHGFFCNNEECSFHCKKCREIPDEIYCRLCGDNLGTFCSDCKDHYCPCWVNKLAENTERQFRENESKGIYEDEIQEEIEKKKE